MKKIAVTTACALAALGGVAIHAAPEHRDLPKPVRTYAELIRETGLSTPAAIAYGRMAVDVGGKDWPTTVSFRCHATGGHVVSGLTAPPATKVFDNLYYVGDADVSAWALDTPDGIILIDSLTNAKDAQHYVVDGLRSVGLDPARIRYILVSHEHGDHYGGAPLLQQLSGARVGMSEPAWQGLERMTSASPLAASPRPKRDLVLKDGDTVTLGGATVTAVATPGHTPGTLSFILPVQQGGQTHMAAYWGGNGFPGKLEDRRTFLTAIDHFADATTRANVDVELSSHGDTDDLVARLARRRAGARTNPFLVGRESYLRFEEVYRLCSRARMAQVGDTQG
ncbi:MULTISPECIES: MBL fold metallo-hydrolase [unclassified Sphingomonas]|uniref:MBL fold metallo-hydrolase n=1 Tax=unclassified Sphingomonas TaxID=196159 RepID=UPI000E10821F|nr:MULTISPECIES: MBL fold metallo-hydrolase [unclassified Sphingomonas]AXJ94921.1 MBL fold metallo-hydrolase [Sphingomonas sp. FARSPH]